MLAVAAVPVLFCIASLAYSRPGYFTSQTYMFGVMGLELLALAVWRFRQVFFALLMYAFLAAGTGLPGTSVGTKGRWVFLGIGAVVGTLIALKERRLRPGLFDFVALSCVLAALASATVSRYPNLAMLKALSLLLLFLYTASGARVAVEGREDRFLYGLVTGCEILVVGTAAFYATGREVMGNPNSLGAIMGVVATPLLFWGMLVAKDRFTRSRRVAIFFLCLYLVYYSHARAGMLAAAVSCAFLCLGLRQYKMLIKGSGIALFMVAAASILQPQKVSNSFSEFTSDVVYKGFQERGVLASRQSPWNEAMDVIDTHFWFGTGFGTKDTPFDSTMSTDGAPSDFARAEYGNSYLAVVAWLGIVGMVPFLLLLLLLIAPLVLTFRWMRSTGNAHHPAVPLALVVIAGLVHAGLEDWLFAAGYYLCVFFWSMAFVLVDIAPSASRLPASSFYSRLNPLLRERALLAPEQS